MKGYVKVLMNKNIFLRITVIVTLAALMVFNLFFSGRFNIKDYSAPQTKADVVSCIYSEINSFRGGDYTMEIRPSEDSRFTDIIITENVSEFTDTMVRSFRVSKNALNTVRQLVDFYGMPSWNDNYTAPADSNEYYASTLLVRYSDDSVLYINDQLLSSTHKNAFDEVIRSISELAVNSNSHLRLDRKKGSTTGAFPFTPENSMELRVEFINDGYLSVYVSNHTGELRTYTTAYKLEKMKMNKWTVLEKTASDNQEVSEQPGEYTIDDMQIFSHQINLNDFGTLTPGTYRITLDNQISSEFILK